VKKGDVLAVAIDTLPCPQILSLAKGSKVFLCESTYLDKHKELAREHHHLTATQAAKFAAEAGVNQLILTHFSARYQDLSEFEKEASAIFPNTLVADDLKQFPFPK
jgi:ribonuclease Z